MSERAPEQANDLESLLGSFDTEAPFSRKIRSLSGEFYTRQDIFDLEQKRVYGRAWKPFRFASQFKEPGKSEAVMINGRPVIIVRGNDGVLRALENTCTHKGAQLLVPQNLNARMEDARQCVTKCLVCPNHRWKFRNSGQLVHIPRNDDIDKEEESLKPLPIVEEWGPYIWMNPEPTGPSLGQRLAPLAQNLDMQEIAAMEYDGYEVFVLNCNAKIYAIDNYHDGLYHADAHPQLGSALNIEDYRTDLYDHCNVQRCPMVVSDDPVVAAVRTGKECQYWGVFPNFMLNYSEGAMDIDIVEALGPGKCRVTFHFYFAKNWSPERREESKKMARITQEQDRILCAKIQDGMPGFKGGKYVDCEIGVWQMQKMYVEAMRTP